jgi:uncharacterized protein with PQ loop repeat
VHALSTRFASSTKTQKKKTSKKIPFFLFLLLNFSSNVFINFGLLKKNKNKMSPKDYYSLFNDSGANLEFI